MRELSHYGKPLQQIRYDGTLMPQSPIVHGVPADIASSGKRNHGLGRRMPFVLHLDQDGGERKYEPADVPVVSGNAIRGVLRDILAEHFFYFFNMDPKSVNKMLFMLLSSGGVTARGVRVENMEVEFRRQVHANLPMVRLLGGVLNGRNFHGNLICEIAVPHIRGLEFATGQPGVMSYWDLTALSEKAVRYTRTDDAEAGPDEVVVQIGKERGRKAPVDLGGEEQVSLENTSAQMIYSTDVIPAGLPLWHGFSITNADPVLHSAFDFALTEFQERARMGGWVRIGHGRMQMSYNCTAERDKGRAYEEFLQSNKDNIMKTLDMLVKAVEKDEEKLKGATSGRGRQAPASTPD